MFDAQLKGKLSRAQENLEDILTSNVFGAFRYSPAQDGLFQLLARARDADGKTPLKGLDPFSTPAYEFWPLLEESGCIRCEPDLLIKLTDSLGHKTYVLVEAKYKSPKSSEANSGDLPYDQLAREWDNLISLAEMANAKHYLLYITAHFGYPKEDVKAARAEYISKRNKSFDILWLSWREIPKYFDNSPHEIIRDMTKILRRLGLVFFEGFHVAAIETFMWRFKIIKHDRDDPETSRFNWSYRSPERTWRFEVFSKRSLLGGFPNE